MHRFFFDASKLDVHKATVDVVGLIGGEDVALNKFLSRRFNSLIILNSDLYIYNNDLSSHNAG